MMDREPPDELTPKVRRDFCKRVKDGMLIEHAAADLLVSEELLEDWFSRADAGEEPFATFGLELARASALAQADALEAIRDATLPGKEGRPDWRGKAWWLERLWPKQFGRRSVKEHVIRHELEGILDAIEPYMSREAYAEAVRALAIVQGLAQPEAREDDGGPRVH